MTLLHLLLRRGSDNIMNPQPNNSADTELKADVPDVVEQKVVSGANNRAELTVQGGQKPPHRQWEICESVPLQEKTICEHS